ncbi:MFS transporter [Pseudomonas sp. NPDC088444]|uniref:MFS transporter n=1 Tax=Pseudomonas sp. NPDC088444 TaxID=3364456 RepID=UPI00385135D1
MTDVSMHGSIPDASDSYQRLSPRTRFWLLASITLSFLAGSSVPTPIYPIYQSAWHFSAVTITLIFSVYALSVLAALLVFGRVSDYIGRRPVLLVTTAMQLVAMYSLGTANGLGDLITGRVLQGLSTGAAVSAVGAGLIQLHAQRGAIANAIAPVSGSAIGALLGSVMVQFIPFPTHTVFAVLAGVLVIQFIGVVMLKDTQPSRPGAIRSLIPQFSVPAQVRSAMLIASAVFIAGWAVAGFYASLGPGLIKHVFELPASAIGGLALAAFSGSGVAAILAMRMRSARTFAWAGSLGLLMGMVSVLVSLHLHSLLFFFLGIAMAGAGFGAGFQGGIRLVVALARPAELAGVLSVSFLCCYLGMGVPAIAAGYEVANGADIVVTAQVFGVVIMGLAVLAMLGLLRTREA